MKKLIGIVSPGPRHGKTTLANYLVGFGWVRAPLAAGLKKMGEEFLKDCGFTAEERARFSEGPGKEEPVPGLGISMRRFWQVMGTEVGRHLDEDLWIKTWCLRNAPLLEGSDACIVIDDIRRRNEAELVRERGGTLIWLDRHDAPAFTWSHASEGELKAEDCDLVWRDQTLDSLRMWANWLHGRVPTEFPLASSGNSVGPGRADG